MHSLCVPTKWDRTLEDLLDVVSAWIEPKFSESCRQINAVVRSGGQDSLPIGTCYFNRIERVLVCRKKGCVWGIIYAYLLFNSLF